jgi:hypothetical protein
MEDVQDGPPVGVETDVLPVGDATVVVPIEGDGQVREVQSVPVHVGDHLVDGGTLDLFPGGADLERGHLNLPLVEKGAYEPLDMARSDRRVVALDVDVDVGRARARHLPEPIGTRRVVGAGHDRGHVVGVAGFDDLLAVGGHEQVGENRGARRPPEHLHHHRHTRDLTQGLSGQARGAEPRRDHAKDDHAVTLPENQDRAPRVVGQFDSSG